MKLVKNGIYRHYEGDYYLLLDVAYHSETLEKMVVYRALYDECKCWVSPYALFVEELDSKEYPNAKQKHRFELQQIKSVKLEKV